MIVGWSSSQSYADSGRVYPDTAGVSISFETLADTITVTIVNLSGQSVNDLVVTDYTAAGCEIVSCLVDGGSSTPTAESDSGLVFSDRVTTRWTIGQFSDRAVISYYTYSNMMYFSAVRPYPIFGVLPSIGAVRSLEWQQ